MPDHLALLNDVEECKTWLERASKAARAASRTLGRSSDTDRSAALREAASSILPSSAFISPSSTLRSEGDMSASAASLMFARAWLPPAQNTPPRVLH